MHLSPLDLVIIAASIVISFLPAIFFYKRASSSTTEFFTSGRAAPWWLVGVSKAATFVRGFRAIYLGLFFNCVIMATVNLAAAKIANIVLGWPMWQTLLLCSTITIFFASVSGLWGVLVTDSIQFTITMTATFAVAYFAVKQPQVGGLAGLLRQIDPKTLNLLPDFGNWSVALPVIIIPITIQCGRCGIPAPSPAAGATSRNGCSRRAPRGTPSAGLCSSTRCTTRCARGRGSSW